LAQLKAELSGLPRQGAASLGACSWACCHATGNVCLQSGNKKTLLENCATRDFTTQHATFTPCLELFTYALVAQFPRLHLCFLLNLQANIIVASISGSKPRAIPCTQSERDMLFSPTNTPSLFKNKSSKSANISPALTHRSSYVYQFS